VNGAKYPGQAERWTEDAYADAHAYLAHRAQLIVSLGPPLRPGDTVLDLVCGEGGLAEHLAGLRYLGVCAAFRGGRNT
jgi:cyclopropane fatty-acyl-phospholipid synthase-like methyltransferase